MANNTDVKKILQFIYFKCESVEFAFDSLQPNLRPSALVQFSIDLSVIKIIHEKKKVKKQMRERRKRLFMKRFCTK